MRPTLKNPVEIEKMRAAGALAAQTLDYITPHVQAGVSTLTLNDLCHNFIVAQGGIPAPLQYRGYPKSVCISRNDVICHGIPSAQEILQNGDIVNIDVTVILEGYHGDTSRMYCVGEVSSTAQLLVDVTYQALMRAIATVESGSWLSGISKAIQTEADAYGFGVVQEFVGHGIGKQFHEEPQVLHYWPHQNPDVRLRKGYCFTIEPMINTGTWESVLLTDGWTAKTKDGGLSAQFEHTVCVTEAGCEILTTSPAGLHKPPY